MIERSVSWRGKPFRHGLMRPPPGEYDPVALRPRAITVDRLPQLPDRLTQQLVLQADWLQVNWRDRRLPVQYLPADGPADRAQELFRAVYAEFDPEARRVAAEVLDVSPTRRRCGRD